MSITNPYLIMQLNILGFLDLETGIAFLCTFSRQSIRKSWSIVIV